MRCEESKIHSSQERRCSECGKNIPYKPQGRRIVCSKECSKTRNRRMRKYWSNSPEGKERFRLYHLKHQAKKYPDKYFRRLMDLLCIAEQLGWIQRKNGDIEVIK